MKTFYEMLETMNMDRRNPSGTDVKKQTWENPVGFGPNYPSYVCPICHHSNWHGDKKCKMCRASLINNDRRKNYSINADNKSSVGVKREELNNEIKKGKNMKTFEEYCEAIGMSAKIAPAYGPGQGVIGMEEQKALNFLRVKVREGNSVVIDNVFNNLCQRFPYLTNQLIQVRNGG